VSTHQHLHASVCSFPALIRFEVARKTPVIEHDKVVLNPILSGMKTSKCNLVASFPTIVRANRGRSGMECKACGSVMRRSLPQAGCKNTDYHWRRLAGADIAHLTNFPNQWESRSTMHSTCVSISNNHLIWTAVSVSCAIIVRYPGPILRKCGLIPPAHKDYSGSLLRLHDIAFNCIHRITCPLAKRGILVSSMSGV
jgi:hypothetical protein